MTYLLSEEEAAEIYHKCNSMSLEEFMGEIINVEKTVYFVVTDGDFKTKGLIDYNTYKDLLSRSDIDIWKRGYNKDCDFYLDNYTIFNYVNEFKHALDYSINYIGIDTNKGNDFFSCIVDNSTIFNCPLCNCSINRYDQTRTGSFLTVSNSGFEFLCWSCNPIKPIKVLS